MNVLPTTQLEEYFMLKTILNKFTEEQGELLVQKGFQRLPDEARGTRLASTKMFTLQR